MSAAAATERALVVEADCHLPAGAGCQGYAVAVFEDADGDFWPLSCSAALKLAGRFDPRKRYRIEVREVG